MKCQQIDEYIMHYCDNTLSPELRVLVDEHLSACVSCQNKVKLTRMENSILAEGLVIPPLSEDFTARVMQSLCKTPEVPAETTESVFSSAAKQKRHHFYLGGAAAAAVILIALSVPGVFHMNNQLQTADICGESTPPLQYEEPADNDACTDFKTRYGQNSELYSGADKKSADYVQPEDIRAAGIPKPVPEDEYSINSHNYTSNESLPYVPPTNSTQKSAALYNKNMDDSVSGSVGSDSTSIASLPSELIKAEISPNGYELDLLSIHPDNLPPEYKLDKIISTSSEETTFIYKNTETMNNLEIIVSFAADTSSMDGFEKSVYDANNGSAADPSKESLYAGGAEMNFVNLELLHKNCTLNLIFKSLMPFEELESLANSITFDDGVADEPVD